MEIKKSGFPYLVDISISTACPFACQFCYTSSLKKGKHADIASMGELAHALFTSNVFEVVFGGGEPTLHPEIGNIVETYKKHFQFKVGVTTKNYNLDKVKSFEDINTHVDSIAFSCNTIEELVKVQELQTRLKNNKKYLRPKLYIQNVLGLYDFQQLQQFLTTARVMHFNNITLLGYKDFGFGQNQKAFDIPDDWMDFVKELDINIGIDSILAQKYAAKLEERGVRNYALVGAEGKSSCYIDVVRAQLKSSSFTNDFVDIPFLDTQNYARRNFYSGSQDPKYFSDWFLQEFAKL